MVFRNKHIAIILAVVIIMVFVGCKVMIRCNDNHQHKDTQVGCEICKLIDTCRVMEQVIQLFCIVGLAQYIKVVHSVVVYKLINTKLYILTLVKMKVRMDN